MSTEEQDAAILRLVKDRAETKRKKSLLRNDLQSFGRSLSSIGYVLQNIGTSIGDPAKTNEKLDAVRELPNLPKIVEMAREYLELEQHLKLLDTQSTEIGID